MQQQLPLSQVEQVPTLSQAESEVSQEELGSQGAEPGKAEALAMVTSNLSQLSDGCLPETAEVQAEGLMMMSQGSQCSQSIIPISQQSQVSDDLGELGASQTLSQ